MEYQDLKSGIRNHLNDAAEDFFMVGYFLRQISENALFTEDGYKSIWDFAKGEYGLSTSSASRFMAINARFSIDTGNGLGRKPGCAVLRADTGGRGKHLAQPEP